jgi:membrane fusion protein (multidrug efflux system)
MYYSVQTPSAVIENNPLVLGTRVPAQVTEVLVKKNERVLAGQALIRFASRTHMPNAAEARAQAASVRNLLPPPADMEDVARRVADAQAAEQDVVNRIMQARALEDEAARDVQRKAEEHARTQLELRRLDLLSGQYSVPRAQHDQARSDEYGARQQLEKARATREEHSRVRAATEGELYRIKTELTELKTANRQARGMPGHVRKAAPTPPHAPSAPDDSVIVAPADAVVTDVFVQPGIWAQPDQQLIALMPDAASLEATAWFPEKAGANIQPGQLCRVFVLELPGKSFSGKVEHVLPADSLALKPPLAASAQTRQVPVRIRFSAKDAGHSAELKSGMRAAVRVHHFTPPWMHIGTSAARIMTR